MRQYPNYSYDSWDSIKESVSPYYLGYEFHLPPNKEKVLYQLNSENKHEYITTDKYDDSEIKFKLNNLLFRTEQFANLNPEAKTALYSGCSFTYGVGIPEEFLWTTLLSQKLEIEQHFNL